MLAMNQFLRIFKHQLVSLGQLCSRRIHTWPALSTPTATLVAEHHPIWNKAPYNWTVTSHSVSSGSQLTISPSGCS
ncbi:hypothetical protein BDZ91DRAFT_724098 [Kalaharituber pfeilii]|nr:hypothetical protein BDZ91DRAFT_724098 [Kalaharituber pfeilii]